MTIRRAAAVLGALFVLAAPVPAAEGDTRPDLSGVWLAYGASGGGGAQLSEQGRAVVDAFYAQYREVPEAGAYCVPTGMPTVMTSIAGYPIEILQQADRITMLAEREMQVRRIYLDGRSHPDADEYPPTAIGHSIGRWEGDTLVIDTTLLSESLLRQWPRSAETRIVERLQLLHETEVSYNRAGFIVQEPIDEHVLVLEITLEDPTLYAAPQRRTVYYRRISDDSILEYDCAREAWLEELERHRVE